MKTKNDKWLILINGVWRNLAIWLLHHQAFICTTKNSCSTAKRKRRSRLAHRASTLYVPIMEKLDFIGNIEMQARFLPTWLKNDQNKIAQMKAIFLEKLRILMNFYKLHHNFRQWRGNIITLLPVASWLQRVSERLIFHSAGRWDNDSQSTSSNGLAGRLLILRIQRDNRSVRLLD